MKSVQINSLLGSYGTARHEDIWKAVRRFGYERIYIALDEAKTGDLDYIRLERKTQVGLIIDPTWWNINKRTPQRIALAEKHNITYTPEGLDPMGEALLTDRVMKDLGYSDLKLAIMFDDEHHDSARIISLLKAWRAIRPTRETGWSFEPFQGGWFNSELVFQINTDRNLTLYPQLYFGDMTPVSEGAAWRDLMGKTIRMDKLRSVFGAVSKLSPQVPYPLPINWDGMDFTMELRNATSG